MSVIHHDSSLSKCSKQKHSFHSLEMFKDCIFARRWVLLFRALAEWIIVLMGTSLKIVTFLCHIGTSLWMLYKKILRTHTMPQYHSISEICTSLRLNQCYELIFCSNLNIQILSICWKFFEEKEGCTWCLSFVITLCWMNLMPAPKGE